MKKLPLAMMMFGLLAYGKQAAGIDGYHTFTSVDGRMIDANIVEYDRDRKLLKIERRDRQSVWVAPDVFSEADRAYILEWIKADRILSERSLRVCLEKKVQSAGADTEFVSYEIKLWNQSGGPIDGLQIEYRYFMELSSSRTEIEDSMRVVGGHLNSGQLEDQSQQKLRTRTVRDFQEFNNYRPQKLYDENGNEYVFQDTDPLGECRIKGIWIRIHGPSVGGVPTYRDICDPESLDGLVSWDDKLPALEDGFSFSNMKPPRSEKKVMPLDEVKKRGKAETAIQQSEWMKAVRKQFEHELSSEEVRELNDGVRFFYNASFDTSGGTAAYMGSTCKSLGLLSEAVAWYEMAVREEDPCGIRRSLVMLYACSNDPSVRNGTKAVEHAKMALEKDEKDRRLLDLMARAYAANNQFDLAVATQRMALRRFEKVVGRNRSGYAEFKKRLKLYENGKLYIVKDLKQL